MSDGLGGSGVYMGVRGSHCDAFGDSGEYTGVVGSDCDAFGDSGEYTGVAGSCITCGDSGDIGNSGDGI